ncbi:MAG TPA: TatD family hydrolase [Arenimonas sp.]|nr:TatD family hydrolase [Arenimonas sp.]HOZ05735.1 TatD family hydrolase [Arenimonas sp.]HPO24021.1 TatD family hydrolase [Arenimonas sp.]HPW32260.1 TatD family hydrolase [Arenimonas sp.]
MPHFDLFDSHSHLDAPEFEHDRSEVLARAQAEGVNRQLLPAVEFASWSNLKDVCDRYAGLYPAYGLHPMYLASHRPEHIPALRHWIEKEKPNAVGECGLDFFIEGLDPELQRFYFIEQLKLAREFELPVVIHARRAVDEVIASIRKIGALRGVIHSYSGSEEQARQLFNLGFSLGIGGPITYERAQRLRRLVTAMPMEFLLLETDSPDQPNADHRGQRNEPARLLDVLRIVAELRKQPVEEIARATTANAVAIFLK